MSIMHCKPDRLVAAITKNTFRTFSDETVVSMTIVCGAVLGFLIRSHVIDKQLSGKFKELVKIENFFMPRHEMIYK